MKREFERLLNDHDNTYAHTITGLEKRLVVKSDLMMRKLDEILHGSNWEERSTPRELSRQANDGDGARSYAGAQQNLRTSYGSKHRERARAALSSPIESDGCIDTWIEMMKLHFEEENLSKKQEGSALTNNLEGTLKCVMAKRANEQDSARKIFDILLNRFGSGVQGNQAMAKFEKRRQRDDESIDKFLDDLELF